MAFAAAVVFSFVLGVVIERMILRPLHNAPVLSVVVVFIGLLAIFNSMAGAIWSYTIKEFPRRSPRSASASRASSARTRSASSLVTLIVLGLLFAFFRFTPLGLAMRAAAQNPQIGAPGRRPRRLDAGAGLGAGRGDRRGRRHAWWRHIVYLDPNMMASILLYAFAGALVGGIGNPGRRGGRRLHRRRAREPGRLLSAT